MKFRYLLILAILLVACAQEVEVQEVQVQVQEQAEEPIVEETQGEIIVEKPEELMIDEKTKTLLVRSEKIKSMKFVYVGPPKNLPQDIYYFYGDNVKIELYQETDHKLSQKFTHVYIYAGKAGSFCNVRDMMRCPDGITFEGFVKKSDYEVKSPLEWMQELETAEYTGNAPQFENKAASKIKFTTATTSGEMHIIDFLGIPGRIKLDDGSEIEFRELSVNALKPEDVEPPKE